MEDLELFSVKEVADTLKVSKSVIYKAVKTSELEAYTVGNQLRFSKEQVQTYLTGVQKNG